MAGNMGNKKYLSKQNEELSLLKALKNYLDRQDIYTLGCRKVGELAQEVNC